MGGGEPKIELRIVDLLSISQKTLNNPKAI
jgi:hypothetical protein